MVTQKQVFDFIVKTYAVTPDYPWKNHPNYAVFRHKENQKWFCLVMDITADKLGLERSKKIDVINIKVNKAFIGGLREKKGIYPAYHMNKANWITIDLEEIEKIDQIEDLIKESYELTV
ncbi:MmcQ/YjbR family DNA-binding protein [Staphylococcus sp. 17KM0847]|uniref:MmcQ/YjbR family DNA-binding protein n=1 Tax=Staphylococcus sp. 17KM0847 TaxID=2583989 RepID=UPI0015DBE576|nr:MmcQ/YjbR family DNA-binding protein [Staphylococcus sp. 17KM0847]QLK86529.1 MmcQ/YjbR family DNA-binding protein [Staphylococcus sp. 17KM0847]